MKPRIALIHYAVPPVVGGVEAVIAQHTHLLLEAGYAVSVITGDGGSDPVFKDARVMLIPEMDTQYPENLDIAARMGEGPPPPEFYRLQERIESELDRLWDDFDIVIVHNMLNIQFNLSATAALCRVMQRHAARGIVWCHDISRYVRPDSGAAPRFGGPWDLLRTYRPELIYVAVSRQRQRQLAQTLACPLERIRVISNGVDPAMLFGLSELGQSLVNAWRLLEADLIALMPIRITQAKNIEFALHVMAALKTMELSPRLVVTGPADPHHADSSDYFDELLRLRHELELEREVCFVYEGLLNTSPHLTISTEVVAELYRVCDLVLMPSWREGFGLPVIEGGLIGRPVFATAIPVVEEVGAELIRLIRVDESPAEVAARIKAWADEDRTQGLRRKTRQQYPWPAIFSHAIEPLLAEVAQRTGRPM